jgi:hypothetical protein
MKVISQKSSAIYMKICIEINQIGGVRTAAVVFQLMIIRPIEHTEWRCYRCLTDKDNSIAEHDIPIAMIWVEF